MKGVRFFFIYLFIVNALANRVNTNFEFNKEMSSSRKEDFDKNRRISKDVYDKNNEKPKRDFKVPRFKEQFQPLKERSCKA